MLPRPPHLAAIGALVGAFLYLDLRAVGAGVPGDSVAALVGGAAVMAVVFAVVLRLLRRGVRSLVCKLLEPDAVEAYVARDGWAYTAFLLLGAGAFGVRLSIPLAYLVVGTFVVLHVVVALASISAAKPSGGESFFDSDAWLAILFLASGMAALVYEVVWQRVLFSIYGVNVESVTLIVALFMFGLGVGALAGGAVSRRHPDRIPWLFAACELGIGAFGAVSVPLMEWVGARTLAMPLWGVAGAIALLLLVPVLLMGATLPLLVEHLTRHHETVGGAMGRLYALNTLGAAIASLVTVDVLFVLLGRQATVFVAVTLNVLVAVLVYRFARRLGAKDAPSAAPPGTDEAPVAASRERLPLPAVLGLAFFAGFLSLSQEIVWMRPLAFATQGAPQVFGQVLGVFLVGVAAGAWKAKKLCEAGGGGILVHVGRRLVAAGVLYYLALPLFGGAMVLSRGVGVPVGYVLVGLVAYMMGLVLPLLGDLGTSDGATGRGVSFVYAANVAGATAGPLFTGFFLLERLSFSQCTVLVACATLAVGVAVLHASGALRRGELRRYGRLAALAVAVAVLVHRPLYLHLPERLRDGPTYDPARPFDEIIQNRSGILSVRREADGDMMYGGGIYDGRFNVDPVKNTNEISRAYAVGALHREPRHVLEIGLSTGSWTWALAAHRSVESITVVEINPGYEALIRARSPHREILEDPRIAIHHDDGRRWLLRHPDARFDFILMNTTYHWRSNMTNLLSREFMELCRRRLNPGGVLYFNATRNPDAGRTAAEVFAHVTMFSSFVVASDAPFDMTVEERREGLRGFLREGRSIYESGGAKGVAELEALASTDFSDRPFRADPQLRVITDDNMNPEFKRIFADSAIGVLYNWYDERSSWRAQLLAR